MPDVETGKLTDFDPNGIVAELGTWTDPLLAERATDAPDGPAGPFNVTVPVRPFPATIELELKLIEVKTAFDTTSVEEADNVP